MTSGRTSTNDADDIDELLESLTSNGQGPRRVVTSGEAVTLSTGGLLVGGLVGLAVAAIIGSLVLSWLALSRSDDDSATATEAGVGATDDLVERRVRGVLDSIGLTGVVVEQQGATVYLTGTVQTEAQRQQAIDATEALIDGRVLDASGLVVLDGSTPTVEDTAPAGPQATPGDDRGAALQTELDRIVATTPIIFDNGVSALNDLQRRILNSVATTMQAYPGIPVTIVGFTDSGGDPQFNQHLSLDRASAVKDYLVSQGVAEASLQVEAQGEAAASGSADLAELERRVEFEVIPATAGTAAAPAGAIRIGVVAPSPVNDLAFTQSMVDALDVLAEERGSVALDIKDNTFLEDEVVAAIRDYATSDYDLIIVHGSEFGPAFVSIAREFPDVAFAWGTGSDTFDLPNVYAYDAAAEQGAYVFGAMSTMLTSSGTLGVVGPLEVGDAKRYVNGYQAGARAESGQARVIVDYIGSFADTALAAEAAERHVEAGADVMTGTAEMVIGAISVAKNNDVLWFATQADQASLAPNLVVASQVYHWEAVLRPILADVDAGVFSGRSLLAELANGGLSVEYNPEYPLPPEVRRRGDELVDQIRSGALVVPVGG